MKNIEKRNIMKKAHMVTKSIIKKGDNYKATLGLVMKFLYKVYKQQQFKIVKTLKTFDTTNGTLSRKLINTKNVEVFKGSVTDCFKYLDNKYLDVKKASDKCFKELKYINAYKELKTKKIMKSIRYEIVEVM